MNFLDLLPFKGFLGKYDNMSYMEHCFPFKSLRIIWYLIKYIREFMQSIFLLELSIPFVSNKISLVFSLFNNGSKLYPCCFRKFLVHNKCDKTSFAATNSASVKLFYWSFDSFKLFVFILYPWLIHLPCDFSYLHVPQIQHQNTSLP